MSETVTKAKKRGLLIGINNYPNLGPKAALDGCLNDVSAISQLLVDTFEFPSDALTVLRDEQATRTGILDAFDSLIQATEKDDVIVIQFSGHGSQMTARLGSKPNGLDQTIVPYDSGRKDKPNRDIVDNEIYLKMLALTDKTPFVTFIFDSCHSGTIVRDPFANKVRFVEPDLRSIEELPPLPITGDQLTKIETALSTAAPLALSRRYVLLASCRDEEVSFEHSAGSVRHGAFTYFLCQQLSTTGQGGSFRDVFETTRAAVVSNYPAQHPQLEGVWDRAVFSRETCTLKKYLLVKERRGSLITLNAGAAQGMTVGSRWRVYPPGTRTDEQREGKIGSVEMRQVRAVTSEAAVVDESGEGAIAAGCRAFKETHSYGEMRTIVSIQAPADFDAARRDIACRINDSHLLRIADEDEDANVRIYLIPARKEAGSCDPVPQISRVAEPTWAAVSKSGGLLVPTCPAQDTSRLIQNLEKEARYRNIRDLT
ncbi:MAG: caspase family protein, partial [Blastocatellia bacterium]